MKTNCQIIRKLMVEYIRLIAICDRFIMAELDIEDLEEIDLFDIVLDLIGFPEQARTVTAFVEGIGMYTYESRSKWYTEAVVVKEQDVDAFLEKLYAEYNELLTEQPELFVKGSKDQGF